MTGESKGIEGASKVLTFGASCTSEVAMHLRLISVYAFRMLSAGTSVIAGAT
jgi:hypothetical protein